MSIKDEILDGVYNAKNNEELAHQYDKWAKDYEQDMFEGLGYVGPKPIVDMVVKHTNNDAKILDAGAGAGMVGVQLHQLGYQQLMAIDISQGMLTQTRQKNVYTECHQMTLGEPLAFPTDSFDVIIVAGVFAEGHAPANSFDELIRITKPQGVIVFTLRPDFYEQSGFKEKQSALEADGKWQLVEVGDKYQFLPASHPDLYMQVWVYRVASAT